MWAFPSSRMIRVTQLQGTLMVPVTFEEAPWSFEGLAQASPLSPPPHSPRAQLRLTAARMSPPRVPTPARAGAAGGLRAGPGPRPGEVAGAFIVLNVESVKTRVWTIYPASRDQGVIILWCSWYKRNAEFLRVDVSRAQPCFCHGPLGVCVHRAICPGPTPSLPPAFLVTSARTWVSSGLCLPSVPTSHQSLLPTQAPVEPLCWSRTASHVTHFPGLFPIRPSSTRWLERLCLI